MGTVFERQGDREQINQQGETFLQILRPDRSPRIWATNLPSDGTDSFFLFFYPRLFFYCSCSLPNPAHPWRSDSPPPATSLPSSADPSSFVLLLSHVLFLTFPFPPPDPVAPSCRREQRPVTPSYSAPTSVLLPGAAVGDPQLITTVPGSVPDRPQAHRIWTPREEIDILTIPAPHP